MKEMLELINKTKNCIFCNKKLCNGFEADGFFEIFDNSLLFNNNCKIKITKSCDNLEKSKNRYSENYIIEYNKFYEHNVSFSIYDSSKCVNITIDYIGKYSLIDIFENKIINNQMKRIDKIKLDFIDWKLDQKTSNQILMDKLNKLILLK